MNSFADLYAMFTELRKNKTKAICPFCTNNTMIPYFGIDNGNMKFITLCCKKYISFAEVDVNGSKFMYPVEVER